MMKCRYFREEQTFHRSNEIRPDRQITGNATSAPWCAHDPSPVTKIQVTAVLGGSGLLKCGGDIEKCPIKHLLA